MFSDPGRVFTTSIKVSTSGNADVLGVRVEASETAPGAPTRIDAQPAGGGVWTAALPSATIPLAADGHVYFRWLVDYRTGTGSETTRAWPEDRAAHVFGASMTGPQLASPVDGATNVGIPRYDDTANVLVTFFTSVPVEDVHVSVRIEDLASGEVRWSSAPSAVLPRGRIYRWTAFQLQAHHPVEAPPGAVVWAYVPAQQTWTFSTSP
ncbi:MAG: hypothetical protein K8S98_00010 [Planctomycetes bacterium]|nr:hypothetical protein [Planctomycetota bacterium]